MNLTPELKKQIDDMSYEDMLRRQRFDPIGSPLFQGESGEYFIRTWANKRAALPDGTHAQTSKRLGWGD
jgi:hypothetical protein